MFYTLENFQKHLFLVFAKQFLGMKLKTFGRFTALGKTLGNSNEQRPVGKNRPRRKYNQQNKRRKPHHITP